MSRDINCLFYTSINSPVGEIILTSDGTYLTSLYINSLSNYKIENHWFHKPEIFNDVIREINEYFLGTRKTFTIPIKEYGTKFQKLVWQKLKDIDYGKKISYKELAILSGNNKAFRAVGNANNKNKIHIIIPCHRVIASTGKLSGYNCGHEIKKWLLDHESYFK